MGGAVVGVPVVVHDIRENGRALGMELRRPGAAIDVAKAGERGVEGHDPDRKLIVARGHPVLDVEPFQAGALQKVARRVDPAFLRGVGKLARGGRDREGEVNALLGRDRVVVKQQDLRFNRRRMGRFTAQADRLPERRLGHSQDVSPRGGLNRQLGRGPRLDRTHDLRIAVAAADVEVLIEAIRTAAIDDFLLQLLVKDVGDRPARAIHGHTIESVLDHRIVRDLGRRRRGRPCFRIADRVALVPDRRNILGEEAHVQETFFPPQRFQAGKAAGGQILDDGVVEKVRFDQSVPAPVERVEDHQSVSGHMNLIRKLAQRAVHEVVNLETRCAGAAVLYLQLFERFDVIGLGDGNPGGPSVLGKEHNISPDVADELGGRVKRWIKRVSDAGEDLSG